MITEGRTRRAAALCLLVVGAALAAATTASAAGPPPLAADLFPVDDWIGEATKKVASATVGALDLSADAIARVLSLTVVALLDLLIPGSWIRQGTRLLIWVITVPPIGSSGDLRFANLEQLGRTLSWVPLSALPIAFVVAGARQMLATDPTDGVAAVAGRTLASAAGLAFYDTAFAASASSAPKSR